MQVKQKLKNELDRSRNVLNIEPNVINIGSLEF